MLNGRPKCPHRLMVSFRKEAAEKFRLLLPASVETGSEVEIEYKFCGNKVILRGVVQMLHMFPEGTTVILKPSKGDGFANWDTVPIWITNSKSGQFHSGVLS